MRTLKVIDSHSFDELRKEVKSIKGYNDVLDWKIIETVKANPGIDAAVIAQVLCLSIQKVYKVIQDYNKTGKEFKKNSQWGGRRASNSYLSIDEEAEILSRLGKKAGKGLILTARDIRQEFEHAIGGKVSIDYIWRVFKRHNWTKRVPRPEHPNTNYEKQEEFKKNSKKTWQPPH